MNPPDRWWHGFDWVDWTILVIVACCALATVACTAALVLEP